jgi:hypothetical protein
LNYCLGELQQIDEKTFNQLYDQLNLGIKENFKESRAFWDQHQNPLEPLFKSSYNAFLKVNNQQEGIMSYNLVVGLLVNYYKTNNL